MKLNHVLAAVFLTATMLLTAVDIARAGVMAYATTGSGGTISDLYTVDVMTGSSTFIGRTGYALNSIVSHNGVLYGTERNGGFLVTINTSTGAATPILGSLDTFIVSTAIDSSGNAYGWSESGDDLYTIDLTTGDVSFVGESFISTAAHGLAFLGDTLYLHNGAGRIYTIDTNTGAATFTGNSSGISALDGDVNSDDGLYYGVERQGNNIYSVDLSTGTYNSVVADQDFHTLTFATNAVPEPGSLAIFGTICLLGMVRRRQS